MLVALKDMQLFPFLKYAANHAAKIPISSLNDITQKIDNYLFENFSKKYHDNNEEDLQTTLQIFMGSLLVINQIRKERLTRKFAEIEAEIYIERLRYIYNKNGFDDFSIYFTEIFEQVNSSPNLVKKDGNKFLLKVPHYLQLMSKCNDKTDLKLIHHQLIKGYVIFEFETLLLLLKGVITTFLIKKINNLKIVTDFDIKKKRVLKTRFHPPDIILSEDFLKLLSKYEYIDIYTSVHKKLPSTIKDFDVPQLISSIVRLKTGKTPPCINYVIDKFEKGESPTHMERLTTASFLFQKGKDIEEIMEIFSKAPNFNRDITEYQLNHIKNKNYKPSNCDKIENEGFCFRNSSICGLAKNPLNLLS